MQRLDIFAVPKDGNQKLVSRFYKDEQIHHPQVLWFSILWFLSFRPEDVQGNLHRTLFRKNPFIQWWLGDLVTPAFPGWHEIPILFGCPAEAMDDLKVVEAIHLVIRHRWGESEGGGLEGEKTHTPIKLPKFLVFKISKGLNKLTKHLRQDRNWLLFKQILAQRMRVWWQINHFLSLIKWAKHARLPPFKVASHGISPSFTSPKTYLSINGKVLVANDIPFSFWGWFLQFANLFLRRYWCHRSRLPRFCAFMIKGNIRDGPWWDLNGLDVVDQIFFNFPDIHLAEISIFDDEVVIFRKSLHTFLNGFFGGQPKSLSSMVWASSLCFTAW